MNSFENRRILLVDDMPTIHADFRKILAPELGAASALDAAKAALFGDEITAAAPPFELDSAYQGQEGLARVVEALAQGRPYGVAFVDMRMPPGWDGVETVERLWRADPRLQVVFCTAYSDASWEEVLQRLETRDRLLILKKPFDNIEVSQLANTLSVKWQATQQAAAQIDQLEEAVAARTAQLTQANAALQVEIAERKQLETQLVQSQSLASIGQLAAGVAHEINNPISYIFANNGTMETYQGQLFELLRAYRVAEAQLPPPTATSLAALREQVGLDYLHDDMPTLLQESREGLMRVRQIVQDLKDFSRIDTGQEWQRVQLHQGIESTLNLLAGKVQPKADLVREFGQLPEIDCMPLQINQVVLNLVLNAADAIPTGRRGTITLKSGCDCGTHVWLEVKDTGCGIPSEVQPRIFEPFYTTKPVGQGRGLGLSLSYGIMQRHGGRIDVHSLVGQGTTFRLTLPVRRAETAQATHAAHP
ncbi:MAG: ATP-binding protein [Roseateles sp.]|uniref:ATP-binding protein n=1 Tax=Roseateles sp. TaxID=1971397 RepID=UPI004035B31B